jgi:hypothetical protein
MSDSTEIARIRAKVLRIEDELTVDNNTASFSGDVSVSGNLYVIGDLYVSGSSVTTEQELTSALLSYATSTNVSSSVTGVLAAYATSANVSSSVTGVLAAYATSTRVSSSVTGALSSYATSANVSSSVTASVNTLKSDLTASYARLATANIFTTNQTITGTLNASSNISGNANLLIGGNVGIGTSPVDKLDVNGGITVRGARVYHSSSNYQFEFGPGAGTGITDYYGIYAPSGKGIAIYGNAGSAQIFLSGTSVGIGRIPTAKLDIDGATIIRRLDSSTEGGEIQLARAFDNTTKWYIDTQGSGDASNFRIFDNSSSVAFFIESVTRDVGIGTTSPSEKLEVNGAIKIPLATNSDNNSPGIVYASDDDFLYDGLYLNHYGMGFHSPVNTVGAGAYISGYYGIDLFTSGINRFTILTNGNIGIGNDTPSEKIHVVGNAIFGTTFNTVNGYPNADVIIHAGDATASLGQINALTMFRQQSTDSWPQIATFTLGRYEVAGTSPRTRLDFNLKHTADGTDTAEVTAMTLNSNGRLGIGETNPSSPLHVVGNGNTFRLQGTDHTYMEWYPDGATTRKAYTGFPSAAADYFIIANEITTNGHVVLQPGSSAFVGVNTTGPTQTLDINGTVRVRTFSSTAAVGTVYRLTDGTLSLTAPSDIRFKKDIINIENALQKIKQIRGVKFKWDDSRVPQGDFGIDPSLVDKYRIGVIAQEVEKVLPELTFKHQEGKDYLAISYPEFSAVLIEAVKELSTENDYLKNKLEEKDKQIQDILLRLQALESK